MRFAPLALLALSAFGQAPAPRPAPEFSLRMEDGSATRLSAYRGKVVVLALLNTGCPHCQHFAQQLAVYQKEYGPRGVQILAAVFDNGAKAGLKAFRDKYVAGFPIGYSDEATVLAWLKQPVEEGYFVPIVAFIDRRGALVSRHLGDDMFFQDPDGNMRHTLDSLLKSDRLLKTK